MVITKPKDNQILIEDDTFKDFDLEVKSKTGLTDMEFDETYKAFILAYRLPGMDASKQLFLGADVKSLYTLLASSLQNLIEYGVLTVDLLRDMVDTIEVFLDEEHKSEEI